MKNFRQLFFIVLLIAPLALMAKDQQLTNAEIPAAIKSYVTKHFPSQKIVKAELDRDDMSRKYDIKLDNHVELEFNGKSQIRKIDGDEVALPSSVIPQKIAEYVKRNYPENVITDWELDGRYQEVKLNNDVELIFNKAGKFIKRD